MQQFFARFSGILVLFALVFTACEEDDPIIDPIDTPPVARLATEAGFISDDATVTPDSVFMVKLDAEAGSANLNSLRILEDGATLANNRFTLFDAIGAKEITPVNNPQVLSPVTSDGQVTLEIGITAPTAEGTYTYSFEVTDSDQQTAVTEVEITVEIPFTPIAMTLEGVLFNQAGPAGNGALDLDEGFSTGVTTAGQNAGPEDAEIRDLGLDCTIPAPGLNWRQQIGTMNDADMRAVDLTKVENFTFDNVGFIEEIIGAYDTGIDLEDGEAINCANANTTAVTDVSEILTEGDMFVVLRDGRYYLIRIDEVNETNNNNNDNYVISIKY